MKLPLKRLCAAFFRSHLSALGNIHRLCLGDELADDFCGRLVKVRRQICELFLLRIIKSEQEAFPLLRYSSRGEDSMNSRVMTLSQVVEQKRWSNVHRFGLARRH